MLLRGRNLFDWNQAQRALELAADSVDRVREREETRYATSDAAWQESPDGQRLAEWLGALRVRAADLRDGLPEMGNLKMGGSKSETGHARTGIRREDFKREDVPAGH